MVYATIKTNAIIITGKDCKHNKNIHFYLSANNKQTQQYKTCLFGEHLLNDKIICIVEGKKTAVINSFFYPQFDCLATEGNNGLTVAKVQVLIGKQVY